MTLRVLLRSIRRNVKTEPIRRKLRSNLKDVIALSRHKDAQEMQRTLEVALRVLDRIEKTPGAATAFFESERWRTRQQQD